MAFVICRRGCPIARDKREHPLYFSRALEWNPDATKAQVFDSRQEAHAMVLKVQAQSIYGGLPEEDDVVEVFR